MEAYRDNICDMHFQERNIVNITFLYLVGRTHRSNQVTAPEYVFLISELAGEQRFASIVAKRLESLVSLKVT